MPAIYQFDSVEMAYAASQCDDNIHDGDILVVPDFDSPIFPVSMGGTIRPGAVAILCAAWPVAITENAGGFEKGDALFDWAAFEALPGEPAGDYTESVKLAVTAARELGLPVDASAAALAADENLTNGAAA